MIDNRFIKTRYLDIRIIKDTITQCINGQHLIEQTRRPGSQPKQISEWRHSKKTKELIDHISYVGNLNICDMIIDINDVSHDLRGAYIHMALVPHLAQWASARLAYISSEILNNFEGRIILRRSLTYSDPRVEPQIECVYFISDGQYIKIGYTHDLNKRMALLQSGNPRELQVVTTINCLYAGAVADQLHVRLDYCKVHGEWFDITTNQAIELANEYK